MSSTTQVKSDANGKEFLATNKDNFVVLFFNAEFTDQKDIVDSSMSSLASADSLKGRIVIGSVDVEENNELAKELSVLSVPMVVCLAKGRTLAKIDTLDAKKLIKSVEEELKRYELLAGSGDDEDKKDPKERFSDYLKKLTNRAPVMIFMKGDPKQPRCGFSRQLVELLAKHSIKFESFDILQDEDVRQGLKEFSDWPTYPQIYAKGEFIGGLDILKQLEEQGELEKTLASA